MPMVNNTPPSNSQKKPTCGRDAKSGFMAIIAIHPMRIYTMVESIVYLFTRKTLNTIPSAASPHIMPKMVHPKAPRSVIRVKGVYVPAIHKNIAEWSKILNKYLTRSFLKL
jgi:hypothetical protein